MRSEPRRAKTTARRLWWGLLAAVAAWALSAAASAQASIVTVGSPLPASFTATPIGGSLTAINSTLPEPGAHVTSPVNGTVVSWRITGAAGGPFNLRVLRPAGGKNYKGAGTSAPQTPSSTATLTFPTNLPIHAGDTVGLDNVSSPIDQIGGNTSLPGANLLLWSPLLANGETRRGTTQSTTEIGFNADVSYAIAFGGVKRNRSKGTATLAVDVPGAGTLSLTGKGVKAQRIGGAARVSKAVSAAGRVKLRIKAKGKKKRKLNQTGKVKVKVKVTYRPTGVSGAPNTRSKRVKLIKND
jgi:hypothetical protein